MEKKSNLIIIISVVTGVLLATLVGILVYFNLPAQRIRRMLKSANKYIAEENYDEAILTLQKMLEIDPKNEDLYVMLADTYEKNGDIDKEVEFLQEAVTLMPENQKISEVLLDVYPEVTISEAEGTYKDPVKLTLDAPEDSKIYYIITGTGTDDTNSADSSETGNKENEYSEPITLGRNGKYSIEYYAVSKNGYEGEHKNGTYVIELDESKYHFNEWVNEADGRHYYDENGVSVTGWLKLEGKWYLFNSNGVMLTGLQEADGKTYYLGTDGAMLTGWQEINGKRYYFDQSGAMLKNQWIDDTYYVGEDGAMLVDTKTPDGKKVGKDGKKIDESWKQAYIDVIKGGFYIRYDLYDKNTLNDCLNNYSLYDYGTLPDDDLWSYAYINGDNIPELILSRNVEKPFLGGVNGWSNTYEVFSYFDGAVQSIGLYGGITTYDHLSYSNGNNLIYVEFRNPNFDDVYVAGVYSLKLGSSGFIIDHEYNSMHSNQNETGSYFFDNVEFNKDQLQEIVAQNFNEPYMFTSNDGFFIDEAYGENTSTWSYWEDKYTSTEIIDIIKSF